MCIKYLIYLGDCVKLSRFLSPNKGCSVNAPIMLCTRSSFQNKDFKATVLNYVCFLFRMKIPIIAVFGGCSEKFRIKMHLIVENTRNTKSNFSSILTNEIAESGMDKTLFDGLGDL